MGRRIVSDDRHKKLAKSTEKPFLTEPSQQQQIEAETHMGSKVSKKLIIPKNAISFKEQQPKAQIRKLYVKKSREMIKKMAGPEVKIARFITRVDKALSGLQSKVKIVDKENIMSPENSTLSRNRLSITVKVRSFANEESYIDKSLESMELR